VKRVVLLALALLALVPAARAGSGVRAGSPLALAVMSGVETPRLFLAQRAIDRAWGLSEDSVYREVRVPQWRSEGLALSLSAAVPGSGQLYVGEASGYLYLLAEGTGWLTRTLFGRKADDRRDGLVTYAGDPAASGSGWSAARWAQATGGDASDLLALYAADRDAFLRVVATDDRYLAGWAGNDAVSTRAEFRGLRDGEQRMRERQHYAEIGLVLNHVLSAVDALRAARSHNLPLQRDLELRLNSGWRDGGPALTAVLRRTF
jgi:hypothetical protein